MLHAAYGPSLRLVHKAFPLRPEPDPTVAWNDYRARNWARAASMPESAVFRPWPADKPYPQWSLPALEAAKWAAAQGEDAFARLDARLFDAFFAEGQDISQPEVLAAVATEVGLPGEDLPPCLAQGTYREAVFADFAEAINAYGITAIPAVVMPDGEVIFGAVPRSRYEQSIERLLAAR